MSQPELKFTVKLQEGKDIIPVEAEYLSKYSVYVNFLNGKTFPNGFIFSRAILHHNGHSVKLGPCKLLKNGQKNSINMKERLKD